jgi:hypothetical protein
MRGAQRSAQRSKETQVEWAFLTISKKFDVRVLKMRAALVRMLRNPAAHATFGGGASAATLYPAKMLVFLARCSNPNAVFAIPAGTDDIATHSRLGGQHGEEAKDEDEISGEEGRAQDKAPEEEVKYSPLPVFDFERRR